MDQAGNPLPGKQGDQGSLQLIEIGEAPPVAMREYGDPAGIPTFFFHGWPGSHRQAEPAQEAALAGGIRLLAPDRPGFGSSPARPGHNLRSWADTVLRLADGLGLDCFQILAVSGGAPYACACAHYLPGRVKRLSLLCPAPPFHEIGAEMFLRPPLRRLLWLRRNTGPFACVLVQIGSFLFRHASDRSITRLFRRFQSPPDQKVFSDPELAAKLLGFVREAIRRRPRSIIEEADLLFSPWGFSIREVDLPVEIWHGEEDLTVPSLCSVKTVPLLPKAVLHLVPDEGHYSLPFNLASKVCQKLTRPFPD